MQRSFTMAWSSLDLTAVGPFSFESVLVLQIGPISRSHACSEPITLSQDLHNRFSPPPATSVSVNSPPKLSSRCEPANSCICLSLRAINTQTVSEKRGLTHYIFRRGKTLIWLESCVVKSRALQIRSPLHMRKVNIA